MKVIQQAIKLIFSFCALISAESTAQIQDGIKIQEVQIPMTDGVNLTADLYLPDPLPSGKKFPVLLEYLPYRKTESRGRRFPLYSYFIKHGYIIARVDIRGTGNSGGKLIEYEYSEREQRDGETVIDWLSKQSYSTGNVGMFGISWGGFNSIHMAMRKPPALKAIVALMATDDLYQDDVHFIDGMMHVDAYEIGQDLSNALPGAPDFKIDEAYFANRFDTYPWLLRYKKQQRDGPFWDRASLNSNYNTLTIPTFIIGGWYDGYRDSAPKMLQHVKAPIKAMVGPWNHTFPNQADPPPSVEWRHEAIRWFDYWLKGKNTGIMNEPRFAAFIRDGHEPGAELKEIAGEWRWLNGWPDSTLQNKILYLYPNHSLSPLPNTKTEIHSIKYKASAGYETGGSVMWWGDWAPDQRPADSLSLIYDTEPLTDDIEILGFPIALLNTAANGPQGNWFARLNDVAPDGKVTQVTGAGFNGTHRYSAEQPEKIKPNDFFQLPIEMHFTSWTFQKGHRIRLSISNSQWPMIWPSPNQLTTSIKVGGKSGSTFTIPVITKKENAKPDFLPVAEDSILPGYTSLESGTNSGFAEVSGVTYDTVTNTTKLTAINSGADQYPWGTISYHEKIVHSAQDQNPANASVESTYSITVSVPHRELIWEGILMFRSTKKNFYYTYTRRVSENKKLIRKKTWNEKIKRDYQ